jgi:hypothetical protein
MTTPLLRLSESGMVKGLAKLEDCVRHDQVGQAC